MHQEVASLIPGQGRYPSCGPNPPVGDMQELANPRSLSSMFLSLSKKSNILHERQKPLLPTFPDLSWNCFQSLNHTPQRGNNFIFFTFFNCFYYLFFIYLFFKILTRGYFFIDFQIEQEGEGERETSI
uniref:Uncharacterized protein n=1 Tax=Molossus molossus TaxID=27622 RepID=A0A7J8J653_MOLMO|nr:hypothetical protein HJG59_009560 [Molossus molossus]